MNNENKQKNNIKIHISEKICEVQQKPKWQFMCHNIIVWVLGFITLLVGSIAVAAIIFIETNSGFEYRRATHSSGISHFFQMLPLLWIVLVILFGYATYRLFRQTECGYRYKLTTMVLSVVISSIAGGVILHTVGAGHRADVMAGKLPFHKHVEQKQQDIWTQADKGLLAGRVIVFNRASSSLTLVSFDNATWTVNISTPTPRWEKLVKDEDYVRVVGMVDSTSTFYACDIHPWMMVKNKDLKKLHEDERNIPEQRINRCKDVRPYMLLNKFRVTN